MMLQCEPKILWTKLYALAHAIGQSFTAPASTILGHRHLVSLLDEEVANKGRGCGFFDWLALI